MGAGCGCLRAKITPDFSETIPKHADNSGTIPPKPTSRPSMERSGTLTSEKFNLANTFKAATQGNFNLKTFNAVEARMKIAMYDSISGREVREV